MAPTTPCPTADTLRQLLLGLGDAMFGGELERHLAACPVCAARAADVPADDELVRAVRRAAAPDDTPLPDVVASLLPVFKRLRAAHADVPTASLAPGGSGPDGPDVLGHLGPYAVRGVLGSGGMGTVYRAFDPNLQRPVAVKVIRRDRLAPAAKDQFLAEARAAAAVEHDNIVVVHAVEEHDGVPCIVMPLLKGESLEARLRAAGGPLPPKEVLRVAREMAAGLAAAHAAGLIHRDIKPANVWLEAPTGRVKLLDFGLAVTAGGGPQGLAGTPGYMAPEQIQGHAIDGRADLFGLGCVLVRAATGRPAFPPADPTAAMVQALTRDRPPTPCADPALGRLIDRLLKRQPGDRPASAAAVAAELDAIAARRATLTRRRWLAAVGGAGVLGAAAVWATRPPPVPPVRVEFVPDADVGPITLGDRGEFTLDPARDKALSLPPGEYAVRAVKASPGRDVFPATLVVTAGEPRVVKLALVGQLDESSLPQAVTGVAVGPGGGALTVLSASTDFTLQKWTPGTKEAAKFVRLPWPAQGFAATADGSIAAAAGGNKTEPSDLGIRLFDGRTLELRDTLAGHGRRVSVLALSPNGKQLISGAVGESWVWDIPSGAHKDLPAYRGELTAAAFDPLGKRAVTGDTRGRVVVWDAATWAVLHAVEVPGAVTAVALTPNGFVTAGKDGVIRVWGGETPTARAFEKGKRVHAVAVSRDGTRVLSGGDDGELKLWAAGGAAVHAFAGHTRAVTSVAFTPDGRGAISGGDDRSVRLWRLPPE